MKRMFSLVTVALLATTFAAGCGGKFQNCSEAKSPEDCVDATKFEKDKGGKDVCVWVESKKDAKKGTCFIKAEGEAEKRCNDLDAANCKDTCEVRDGVCVAKKAKKTT